MSEIYLFPILHFVRKLYFPLNVQNLHALLYFVQNLYFPLHVVRTKSIYSLACCAKAIFSIKGTVQRDFLPPPLGSACATDQWVVIFSFFASFLPGYLYFTESPCSIILRGVKFRDLSYNAESSSTQYHTAGSQAIKFERKAPRSIILRRVKLRAVRY